MSPNEAKTRKERIDPALANAKWNVTDLTQVGITLPMTGYDTEPWNGVTNYASSELTTNETPARAVTRQAEHLFQILLHRLLNGGLN